MELWSRPIAHPGAWTAAELGGKAGLVRVLTSAELAAIDELLAQTHNTPATDLTAADWTHPALLTLIGELKDAVMDGRGAMILSGLDRATHDQAACERVFYGLGTHLGQAMSQSQRGDRLGYVQSEDDSPTRRGYRSSAELRWHTDACDIAALMCVNRAEEGGFSRLCSLLRVHDAIYEQHPELLPALYEGWHYAIPECAQSSRPTTPDKIPVFCAVDGTVSSTFSGTFMRGAAEILGEPLPPALDAGVEEVYRQAFDPANHLEFMLEPGEMMYWNNLTVLHARTSFRNAEDTKRLLLRLWLTVPEGRPVTPGIRHHADNYEWVWREKAKAEGLA